MAFEGYARRRTAGVHDITVLDLAGRVVARASSAETNIGDMLQRPDALSSLAPEIRYRVLRQAMRQALSRHAHWFQMPVLMNELDKVRRSLDGAASGAPLPPELPRSEG